MDGTGIVTAMQSQLAGGAFPHRGRMGLPLEMLDENCDCQFNTQHLALAFPRA
jgi:hypothetical protein